MRALRWAVAAALVLVVVAGAGVLTRHLLRKPPVPTQCLVGSRADGYYLDPDQAANAATVAAVGKRAGLPNHAVTVALAAALQESKLRNLDYGDRDSLGLFQQRPSQGWGRADQLLSPRYAASSFYARLRTVPGWRTMPVARAAQRVQLSADGSAYTRWEEQARTLARALTGEVPTGIACQFADPPPPQYRRLQAAARAELGPNWQAPSGAAASWASAAWLVSSAARYGVVGVSVRGRSWDAGNARWTVRPDAGVALRFRMAPAQPA